MARRSGRWGNRVFGEPERAIFCVLEKAYSVWGSDLREENDRFLRTISADFYEKFSQAQSKKDLEDATVRGIESGLTRLVWHHSLETLFCLIGACLQAPNCVFGYFSNCHNNGIREIAKSLLKKQRLKYTYASLEDYSWEGIIKAVYEPTPWVEECPETIDYVARAFEAMAEAYLSDWHRLEYNSLKHGMRVATGPTSFKMANPKGQFDVPDGINIEARDSSHFTHTISSPNLTTGKRRNHLIVERVIVGWSLDRTIKDIQLIAMMIRNVINLIKVIRSTKDQLTFHRPTTDQEWWDDYFKDTSNLRSCNLNENYEFVEENLESETQLIRMFESEE